MEFLYAPKVYVVAATNFFPPPEEAAPGWECPYVIPNSQKVVEFGGRACYRSWKNPAERTNEEYIGNILEHEHFSVLEHAVVSLWITGVSRSLTHELVRHRHLSPSQESQRFVAARDINFVVPPAIIGDEELEGYFKESCQIAHRTYEGLLEELERKYDAVADVTLKKKMVREAARSLLPNASETRILLTGNARTWREVVQKRATIHADAEMCRLAVTIFRLLKTELPAIFQDMYLVSQRAGEQMREVVHTASNSDD